MDNKKRLPIKTIAIEDLAKVHGGSPTLPLPPPEQLSGFKPGNPGYDVASTLFGGFKPGGPQ